jgi:hypothetical protein
MAFGVQPVLVFQYSPLGDESRYADIAREHNWEYTSSGSDDSYADRRTWNRPSSEEDDLGGGFGGVHSE